LTFEEHTEVILVAKIRACIYVSLSTDETDIWGSMLQVVEGALEDNLAAWRKEAARLDRAEVERSTGTALGNAAAHMRREFSEVPAADYLISEFVEDFNLSDMLP